MIVVSLAGLFERDFMSFGLALLIGFADVIGVKLKSRNSSLRLAFRPGKIVRSG